MLRLLRTTAVVLACCVGSAAVPVHARATPDPTSAVTAAAVSALRFDAEYHATVPPLETALRALQSQRLALTVDGWVARLARTGHDTESLTTANYRADRALAEQVRALQAAVDQFALERSTHLTRVAEAVTGLVATGEPAAFTAVLLAADPRLVNMALTALAALSTPYRFGAAGPDGFDCSGFMHYLAPSLPLKAAYQFEHLSGPGAARNGSRPVAPSFGDLLFFSGGTTAAGPLAIGHVGLLLPERIMVHASAATGGVALTALDQMRPAVAFAPIPLA